MIGHYYKISIIFSFALFNLLLTAKKCFAQETITPNICDELSKFTDEEENNFSSQESQEICETIIRALEEKNKEGVSSIDKEAIKNEIIKKQTLNPTSTSALFFDRVGDSVLDRQAISPKSAVEFNASTDSSSASLRIGSEISSGRGNSSSWSLIASSPISGSGNTELATLDGLANAFRLSFNYTDFRITGRRDPFPKFRNELDNICRLAGIEPGCDTEGVIEGLKKTNLSEPERSKIVDEFNSYFVNPNSWNLTYGLSGSLGYDNFEFINSETLEAEEQDEFPWSAGGFFGFTPPNLNALFVVGAEYQSAFRASPERTICPAATGDTAPLNCLTDNIGEPNQQDIILTYIEGRGNLLTAAFSLRVTHDFENDNTGVDLPIYLFRGQNENFTGGLRLGWTDANDDSDLSFGVFVGSRFKLFN